MVSERELTVSEQIDFMRDAYPGLALVTATPWIAMWRGELVPLAGAYEVQFLYSAVSLNMAAIKAKEVHVEVHQPVLKARVDAAIPHIYSNRVSPTLPRLCLHERHEWTPAMAIADTIVPWTVEWLVAYEGWRATGKWLAGGHNTERERLPRRRRW